jgi:beta-glucosidase
VPGATIDKEIDLAAAVAAAKEADVVIACLGEWSYTETPGNINDLTLPDAQLHLVEQLATAGKPVILVMVEGRPRIIRRIVNLASAIVLAPNPGNQGGRAVADVLFGTVNPSGRLPFTYPPAPNALIPYDHKAYQSANQSFGLLSFKPEFAFGSGLSYTTFTYSDLRVSKAQLATNDRSGVTVSVRVANSGQRAGKEVVQLYLGARYASVAPAGKKLKRFAKISLEPGEAREVSFNLLPADFALFNSQGKLAMEETDFDVLAGGLQQTIKVSGRGPEARR